MASENETVADIVAEMRGPYYKMGRSNATLDKQMMDYMSFMANRIEAAAKKSVTDCNHLGNAAKMREALESVRNWYINRLCNSSYQVTIEGLLLIVNAALNVPSRNCDVLSKDEVLEMLKDRSFSKEDTIEWLYAEAKGETDGSK